MSQVEAIKRVLEESDGPMHYLDITRIAQEKGYFHSPNGLTPWRTVNARIIERPHIFKRVKQAYYDLVNKADYEIDIPIPEGNENPEKKTREVTTTDTSSLVAEYVKDHFAIEFERGCYDCGATHDSITGDRLIFHAHHVVPVGDKYHGTDKVENIVPLCPNCHARNHHYEKTGSPKWEENQKKFLKMAEDHLIPINKWRKRIADVVNIEEPQVSYDEVELEELEIIEEITAMINNWYADESGSRDLLLKVKRLLDSFSKKGYWKIKPE